MINILVLLLMLTTASASILDPLFECKSGDKYFSLQIMSSSEGSLRFKDKICSFKINDIQIAQGRVSQHVLDVLFTVPDCHKSIFYKKGFIKIESSSSTVKPIVYVLALKGHQTFLCPARPAGIKKLFNLATESKK